MKASGYNMAFMEPNGYTGLDLDYLKKLRSLSDAFRRGHGERVSHPYP